MNTPNPSQSPSALEGLRVLDVGTFLAGPFAATQLGEFGAEVIKIELPGVGDPLRRFGTPTDCGDTLVWLSEARNKKSITLDLRTPEGAELFKELVKTADVLVENFQTGTLERWNLGWDVLHEVNDQLVMVRITGYGQTGPYSGRPGFARIGQAFGGLSYLAGYPDRPPVTPGSATIADYMTGLYGAFGAMTALKARDVTGKGQYVDIGLYESIFRILDEIAPAYAFKDFVRERMGPGTVNVVPHSHYPTLDKRWIAIACTSDKIFERLAQVMGEPELASEDRWGTIARREAERDDVDALVSAWTSRHNRDELMSLCEKGQVPCGPVYSIDEIFEDPHFAARENLTTFSDPRSGSFTIPSPVPTMSETPPRVDSLGPALGSHNDQIFKDLLGLSDHQIEELKSSGVI